MGQISNIASVRAVVQAAMQNDIVDVVLSPGSRNAPFILSFTAIESFNCLSILDERTAAFVALGMAQQSRKPVLLSCTSGSAMLNYAPAIAEAFHQRIPLIVVTADRPNDWVGQGDGQSIDQMNVLQGVLAKQVCLLKDDEVGAKEENDRLIAEAMLCAHVESRPVQINVPLREPLYETSEWTKPEMAELPKKAAKKNDNLEALSSIWSASSRILILVSQHQHDAQLLDQLKALNDNPSVAIVTETTANLYHFGFVSCIDRSIEGFLGSDREADFVPDLLITIGENLVTKKLKMLFRKRREDIKNHWHFGSEVLDTFHCLTELLDASPSETLRHMSRKHIERPSEFGTKWRGQFFAAEQKHEQFLETAPYCDLTVFKTLHDLIPDSWQWQMGNSSVVRYVQLYNQLNNIRYFGNRGVSGIEGCTSTAVGAAMRTKEHVLFVSGDHAFRYDANGLSLDELPKNLRIIVVNNGGGSIFRIIDGPQKHEASDAFIEHAEEKSVQKLVEYHGAKYASAKTLEEFDTEVQRLFSEDSGCCVLEVFTPREKSPEVLKDYFEGLRS